MINAVENTILYIREYFRNETSGHDLYHSLRVYRTAKALAKQEGADETTVALAALLHDVDDIKLSPATHEKKAHAVAFLTEQGLPAPDIARICRIIDEVSFRGDDSRTPSTLEGMCVQDADRLDALGAVGIARAFAYGGHHGRDLYDPDIKPQMHMTEAEFE